MSESAAEILYRLGLGSDHGRAAIAAAGAIPPLMALLVLVYDSYEESENQGASLEFAKATAFAAGALRNLCSDFGNQKVMLDGGLVEVLVGMLFGDGPEQVREHAAGALASLIQNEASPDIKVCVFLCVVVLVGLVVHLVVSGSLKSWSPVIGLVGLPFFWYLHLPSQVWFFVISHDCAF